MVAQKARVKDESIVNAVKCSALSSKVIAAKKEFAQACQNGVIAAVRKFSNNSGFPIDTPLDLGFSGLQLACRAGHTQVAATLLSKRASLKFKRYGRTNVLQAVAGTKVKETQGPLQCLKMLLPHESMDKNSPAYVDVNDVCNNGYSALMLAARRGHVGMVEALLKAGANKEYKNAKGRTAYDVAVGAGNLNIAKILDPEAEISIDVPSSPNGNPNKKNRAKENPFVAAKLPLDVNDHVEETLEDVGKLVISDIEDSAGVDEAVLDAAEEDSAVNSSYHKESEEAVEVTVEEVLSPVSEETVCNTDLLSYGPSKNPIAFKKDRETGRNRLYLALKLEDLEEYCDKLDRMHINYDRFITFNEQDLRRIGVTNDNHRARMMELISRFRVQNEADAASDRRTSYAKSVRIVSGNSGGETKGTVGGPQHVLSEERKGRRFPGFVSPFSEPISENIKLSAVSGGGFETDIVTTGCGTHQRFAMYLRKLCKLVALFAFLACYFVLEQSDF